MYSIAFKSGLDFCVVSCVAEQERSAAEGSNPAQSGQCPYI